MPEHLPKPSIREQSAATKYLDNEGYEFHLQDVSFCFDKGAEIPTSLKYGEQQFQIEAKKSALTAKDFFAHTEKTIEKGGEEFLTEVRFSNKDAQKYFDNLIGYQIELWLQYLEESTKTELETAGSVDSSGNTPPHLSLIRKLIKERRISQHIPYKDNFLAQGIYDDFYRDALLWLDTLVEEDIPITIHESKLPKECGFDYTIKRVIIGDVHGTQEEEWKIDETIQKSILIASAEFGLYPRGYYDFMPQKNLVVYDTVHLDDNHTKGFLTTQLSHKLRGPGLNITEKGVVFLNNRAWPVVENMKTVDEHTNSQVVETTRYIQLQDAVANTRHEVAHTMDTLAKTEPQAEGFATFTEAGFDQIETRRMLRTGFEYTNEITKGMLETILSSDPPSKNLAVAEIYAVPATFFSWVFENLGSEGFIEFYRRLTGNKKTKGFASTKGNIYGSLQNTPQFKKTSVESTEKFVEAYLEYVNQGVSTIAAN